jgi:hypothetical protein
MGRLQYTAGSVVYGSATCMQTKGLQGEAGAALMRLRHMAAGGACKTERRQGTNAKLIQGARRAPGAGKIASRLLGWGPRNMRTVKMCVVCVCVGVGETGGWGWGGGEWGWGWG